MKRLIALFVLLPLVAFGQLMPIQRNFFTTNPAPVVTVSAGSNVTVQAATTFNTRTFTVNGQTDTNVVSILATNAASGAPIYGSNVVGAVAQATHATNADNATYVTTGQLTNQVYASNVVAGGTMPMGTLATNTGWDGSVLTMTNSGTARVWTQDGSTLTNIPQTAISAGAYWSTNPAAASSISNALSLSSTGVVHRLEAGSANTLTITNGRVGIYTGSPRFTFEAQGAGIFEGYSVLSTGGQDVGGTIIARNAADFAKIRMQTAADDAHYNFLSFDRTRGTWDSPTAVQANDVFGSIVGVANPGTGAWQHGGEIQIYATENWSSTTLGSGLKFFTKISGTTIPVEMLRLYDATAKFGGRVIPDTDAGYDLGTGSARWRDAYFSRAGSFGGPVTSGTTITATNGFTSYGGATIYGDNNRTNATRIDANGLVSSNANGSVTIAGGNTVNSGSVTVTNGVRSYGTNNLVEVDGLGTTITPTVWLTNGTAAALGAQQNSPMLMFGGHGYRSGNSTEMPVAVGLIGQPIQGSSANPTMRLYVGLSISNAAPSATGTYLSSDGSANIGTSLSAGSAITAGQSSAIQWSSRSSMWSPATGDWQLMNAAQDNFSRIFIGPLTAAFPALKVEQTNAPVLSLRNGADNNYTSLLASNVIASANVIASNSIVGFAGTRTFSHTSTSTLITNTATLTSSQWTNGNALEWYNGNIVASVNKTNGTTTLGGTMSATNGNIFQGKHSFTTNFTMVQNIHIYECIGTNQTITMLDTTNSTPWQIYRFASTNGHGKFTLQTAQADQTIRDGSSTTFVQVGIGSPSFYHDGKHWWSAARTRIVMPNACWSLTTNVLLTADVITNVPFNQLEFNNSQGIALVAPGQFYITNAGQYMITFSAVINGGGNNTSISLWMRQSGVDIPRSRTRQVFTSATAQQCMTVNYIFNVTTNNTYFELYAGSHDTGAGIISEAANPTTYTAPAQPGVILTVNKCSDTFP